MITRVAIEADGTAESLARGFWGGCSLDPFEVFYHWYGRMDKMVESLKPLTTGQRERGILPKIYSIQFENLKRLELRFQIGSHLIPRGTHQVFDPADSVTLREQLFEKELENVEQPRKTLAEVAPSNYGHEQSSPAHALPQLIRGIEHSEVDSTEVVPGMHTSTDTQLGAATGFGYVAKCEDPHQVLPPQRPNEQCTASISQRS